MNAAAATMSKRANIPSGLIDHSLRLFALEAEYVVNALMERHHPTLAKKTITIERGRRYARLVIASVGHESSRSVYGFVDMMTGDIVKSESWKKPAKHGVVGSLLDITTWSCIGLYSIGGAVRA
jgi:hypothetical protein